MKAWINLKKLVYATSLYFYTPLNRIAFYLNGIKCGKNFKGRGKIYIYKHYPSANILIGDNVFVNSGNWTNPIGAGDKTYFQVWDNASLIIGDNCGISNCAFSCATEIKIENNVLIGAGCKIYDTDFHALDYDERVKGNYRGAPIKTKPILIKEGAFIGAGSYILKGVTIGRHSVIGAGSVVAKSVPDNEIWAGNPATFIKKIEEQSHV